MLLAMPCRCVNTLSEPTLGASFDLHALKDEHQQSGVHGKKHDDHAASLLHNAAEHEVHLPANTHTHIMSAGEQMQAHFHQHVPLLPVTPADSRCVTPAVTVESGANALLESLSDDEYAPDIDADATPHQVGYLISMMPCRCLSVPRKRRNIADPLAWVIGKSSCVPGGNTES